MLEEGLSLCSSSACTMNENTPVVIGRYRLSKTLGIGAFGKVKRESSRLFFPPRFFCSTLVGRAR